LHRDEPHAVFSKETSVRATPSRPLSGGTQGFRKRSAVRVARGRLRSRNLPLDVLSHSSSPCMAMAINAFLPIRALVSSSVVGPSEIVMVAAPQRGYLD
jgi:hypothetical protein